MAEVERLEALRRQNKHLLQKLNKQSNKLHELKLAHPGNKLLDQSFLCEALTGNSDRHRAPLTERNRDLSGPRDLTYQTKSETCNTIVEQFDGYRKALVPDHHKLKHASSLTAYSKLLQEAGNSRWQGHKRTTRLMIPKTAPRTQEVDQREFERESSLSPGQQNDTASERQRMRPLLGYDWIAGLVDVESSLSERSEEFFSELQSFRQINRDDCVHSSLSGPQFVADLASSTREVQEPKDSGDIHQCTFCYRINSRLFATPLDPQAACPVCKMPKSDHPHTTTEPAIIRVSIPRSRLLPSYKYKAHRRCSFDPSDSLGLPSHCLSGWSNPTLNSGSLMNSLDLRGSLETPAVGSTPSSSNNK